VTIAAKLSLLLEWSGYIAGGFVANLAISALAMVLGTLVGAGLGALRTSPSLLAQQGGGFATSLVRNVPSFVLMFYLAVMLPQEASLPFLGSHVIQPWMKAGLALAIPVSGFVSDAWVGARRNGRSLFDSAARFAWIQYGMIVVMASATASVIGCDDIVARAARVAAITDVQGLLVWCYGYAAAWFLGFGLVVKLVLASVRISTPRHRRSGSDKRAGTV